MSTMTQNHAIAKHWGELTLRKVEHVLESEDDMFYEMEEAYQEYRNNGGLFREDFYAFQAVVDLTTGALMRGRIMICGGGPEGWLEVTPTSGHVEVYGWWGSDKAIHILKSEVAEKLFELVEDLAETYGIG